MRLSQSRIVGSCFLLLSCLKLQHSIEGSVTISPSPIAFVCRDGDNLKVTCNTTESAMQWRLTLMGMIDPVEISVSSTTVHIPRTRINSSQITITRASEIGETPLISLLEIRSINQVLNRTLNITCMEIETTPPISMATTTVHIIGPENGYQPKSPMIVTSEVDFKPDEITVSLQWKQEAYNNLCISYHVSVLPMTNTRIMRDNTWANITLLYNVPYNVSVVADFCGQSNATTQIEVHYANCGDPMDKVFDRRSVVSSGYTNPVEGNTVVFSCPAGFSLIGPNISTCMENGEWEPDPREVNCTGSPITSECDLKLGQKCLTDNQNVPSPGHDVIVGALIGSAVILTTIVTIPIALLMIIKRGTWKWKGFFQRNKGPGTVEHEDDYDIDNPRNQIRGTQAELVYADIGPSSLSTKELITLKLHDSRVEYAQINHGYLVKHSESVMNRQPPRPGLIGDTLSVDLDNLLIQLRPQVSSKWYQFGEAAGIGKDVLDGYAKNCHPGECIVEMLDYWLRNYDAGKPTWRDVARVLRAIGLGRLADDIESVYSTGRLPIEVNMNEMPNLMTNFESIPDHNQEIPPPIPPKTVKQDDTVPVLMPERLQSQLLLCNDDVSSNIAPPRPPKPQN